MLTRGSNSLYLRQILGHCSLGILGKLENLKREPGSMRAALAASATTHLQIVSVLPNFLIFMSTYAFNPLPPTSTGDTDETAVYFIESIL